MSPEPSARTRMLALTCLMAAGVQSVFFRSYVATLTPVFTTEFSLTSQEIGALSTSFFVGYALGHLPAAVAFDRFGVGRVVGPLLLLAAVAVCGVSVAASPTALIVSQALLGAGCSASFVGLFHYAARFHQCDRFVSLANLGSALGLGGGMLASLPLSMLVGTVGWRTALLIIAGLMLVTAVLVHLAVRDAPSAAQARRIDVPALLGDVRRIALMRPLWPIFAICLIVPAVPALRTAWGGQYLTVVFGSTIDEIGMILLFSNLVSFMIMFGGSFISGKGEALNVIYAGIWGTVAVLVCFALLAGAHPAVTAVLFGLISVSGIPHMFLLGRARSLLPANALGLGLGLFGVVIFLGFGIMTTFAGWMLAFGAYLGLSATGSFALVFLATAALIALTALCFPLVASRTSARAYMTRWLAIRPSGRPAAS